MTWGMYPRYYERDSKDGWSDHVREDFAEQALTLRRMGHDIRISHAGLTIDGRVIDDQPFNPGDVPGPRTDLAQHPALQVLDSGALVYRGRIVADLTADVPEPIDGPQWPPQQEDQSGPEPTTAQDGFEEVDL